MASPEQPAESLQGGQGDRHEVERERVMIAAIKYGM